MRFKKFLSILLSVGILISGVPLPVSAAVSRQVWVVKEGMFPFNSSGSSQNVNKTINIPNLIEVTGRYTDNGTVNYSVSGENVTVSLSGGNYFSTPIKGTATATETFSFKTTDSTISKNVSSNRKVLEVLGHTMGSTVSSVTIDSNSNFLKFNLLPGTSNKVQDTSNILSSYDNIESLNNKYVTVSVPNKNYSTLPYFSAIASVETTTISSGTVTTSISTDKKYVTYNFSNGTPIAQVEKDASGNIFREVTERGWIWLTQWFDGSRRWYSTYYKDPNNNQQIIPYDTEIVPGNRYDGSTSWDEWGQSIKDLITDPYYSDGVRRSFNVSSYLNSDWTYVAGYRLHTAQDEIVYTDTRRPFSVDDGVSTDFHNTYIETVKYDSSGLNMHIFSDVYFKGDAIMSTYNRGATEDPRIEKHYQMKYGASFDILRGRNVYDYKAQAKINYYPYTYSYSGSVTYKYETESTETGYIYNGYIKAKYRSLETVQDQPPSPPTGINAGQSQITWIPSTDDYTPQPNIRYSIYYKSKTTGAWVYLGATTGVTSFAWTRSSYPTDGYLKITAYDDVNQYADGYNDPFAALLLTGNLDKTTATQDTVINISAMTESNPRPFGVSYSMPYNNNAGSTALNGNLNKGAYTPFETYSYYNTLSPQSPYTYFYSQITRSSKDLPNSYYFNRDHAFLSTPYGGLGFTNTNPANPSEYFKLGSRGTIIVPALKQTYYDTNYGTYDSESYLRWLSFNGIPPWIFGVAPLNQEIRGNWGITDDYQDFVNSVSEYGGEYMYAPYVAYNDSHGPESYGSEYGWDSIYASTDCGFSKYYVKHMFGLDVLGDILFDPNLPIAVTWDNGRVKVMQPGVVLASGLSSINFENATLIAGSTSNVYNYADGSSDGDSEYPGHELKFKFRGEHVVSKAPWTLDDINTYWYNHMSNTRWNERVGGGQWSIDWSGLQNPIPYTPGNDNWSSSITLPHNIKNGSYVIKLTGTNGSSTATIDLPITVNTPIDVTGTVPGTMEQGKSYTAEAYTSQYVDPGGVILNIFGTNYTMTKSGAFGAYAAGKQKWTYTFTVPASQISGNYDATSGTFAQAKFTATLPGGDSQNSSCKFNVLQPLSSIAGINLNGYVGDLLTVTATTTGYASSAWVEIPGVPSIQLTPAAATANDTNTWTGTFAVPFNFPNGTQNIVYKSSNTRGVGTTSTKTVTIGTRITVTGSVSKPAYITWATSIPTGEKLDITVNVTTLPDISIIEYSTPWFSGTIPLGKKTGSTTVSNLVTPAKIPNTVADGNYTVHIKVTTINGKIAETDLPFTIYTPISVTGDNITISTDEEFKLSCSVTGVIPAMNSITAYVTGTLVTTGGTLTNPTFTLTYNPITGKYESQGLKLLMTSNIGSFPVLYRAATTNNNVSTSNRTLTVTTPMTLTGSVAPATIYAGGNVTVTATVNKWVKSVNVAMPQGTITLNTANKKDNFDGTYTYTQTITIPGTTADKLYNVVFTAYSNNNAAAITDTKTLTVSTPISVTGDNVTIPTDTDFKLSCSVTGALAAMNSITAVVTGTLATTGGTLTNPTFTLTYNPITGKYESTTLKLLMTQNVGTLPITYRASTTNGNVSTSSRTLTVTTPMTLTGNITPTTIHAGGNVVVSATVNKWVKSVTVAMPQGIITLNSAFKASNGDGIYTYTQDITIPGGTVDNLYNIVFTAIPNNNATAITVTKQLTVSTPITIAGDSLTTPTDENFKLSGTVTGATAAISTVKAQVTGTIATTGGTFTNPIYTLTYNAASGKYESTVLKLLMTQNIGSYTITYTSTTTNGNVSTSSKTLTVTTPMDFTPAINPTTVLPGDTISVSAIVNKWIKDITAALPGGSVTLNPGNTFNQQYVVPNTTPDNTYTVTFTGRGYNNAANVVKTFLLNVFTPLNITATVSPASLPASETITIDAWLDTPISINSVTYALTGSYGGSGNMTYIDKSGTISHYRAVYTVDSRHPDGSFAVNITATLTNTKSATVSKPITISTPINLGPYINGENTGCEIYVGQQNTLSAYTTTYPDHFEIDLFGKTYSSLNGEIQVSTIGEHKAWVLVLNLHEEDFPPDGYSGIAAYRAYLPSGRYEAAYLEYNIVGIRAFDFNISLINNVDWRGYYFDLANPIIENGKTIGYPKRTGTDIFTNNLPVNMRPDRSGPVINYSAEGNQISFVRAGTGIKGSITVIGEPDMVKFNAVYESKNGMQTQEVPTSANGPVYSFSWIIPLETKEDSFVYFSLEIEKGSRTYGNEKWFDTWIPGNGQRFIFYIKGNVLRDDIIFNQSN